MCESGRNTGKIIVSNKKAREVFSSLYASSIGSPYNFLTYYDSDAIQSLNWKQQSSDLS